MHKKGEGFLSPFNYKNINNMACDLLAKYEIGCREAAGGVEKVFILGDASSAVTGVTVNADEEITGIDGSGTFYSINQVKQISSLTETGNFDEAAGTIFYTQDIVLQFNKMDAEARNIVKVLAQNPNAVVVVRDNNGQDFYIEKVTMTAETGATGTAFGDSNSFNVTLQGVTFGEPMKLLAGAGLGSADVTLTGITVD
jgi:hypothetical protein